MNHAFHQWQRLEKEVENNNAMNKCQEVHDLHVRAHNKERIEEESADTLTLEQ